jgi:hypothetical protein
MFACGASVPRRVVREEGVADEIDQAVSELLKPAVEGGCRRRAGRTPCKPGRLGHTRSVGRACSVALFQHRHDEV